MKPSVPSLSTYLQRVGVSSKSSPEEIATAKKAYRKLYHRLYYQQRKTAHKRLTIRLTSDQYDRLQQHAGSHGVSSLSKFIIDAALAYLDHRYIHPDKKALQDLQRSIRKISTTINQSVRSVHVVRKTCGVSSNFQADRYLQEIEKRYSHLVDQVEGLNQQIKAWMVHPPLTLQQVLERVIAADIATIDAVIGFLQKAKMKRVNQ